LAEAGTTGRVLSCCISKRDLSTSVCCRELSEITSGLGQELCLGQLYHRLPHSKTLTIVSGKPPIFLVIPNEAEGVDGERKAGLANENVAVR
jgi:hypothetical protein